MATIYKILLVNYARQGRLILLAEANVSDVQEYRTHLLPGQNVMKPYAVSSTVILLNLFQKIQAHSLIHF